MVQSAWIMHGIYIMLFLYSRRVGARNNLVNRTWKTKWKQYKMNDLTRIKSSFNTLGYHFCYKEKLIKKYKYLFSFFLIKIFYLKWICKKSSKYIQSYPVLVFSPYLKSSFNPILYLYFLHISSLVSILSCTCIFSISQV